MDRTFDAVLMGAFFVLVFVVAPLLEGWLK